MLSPKKQSLSSQNLSFLPSNLHRNPGSVLLVLIGILLLIFALFRFYNTPNQEFRRLCDSLFAEELEDDGLSLHYTLSAPEDYDIECSASLPVYSHTQSLADYHTLTANLEELKNISPDSLNETNQQTYKILTQYMEKKIAAYEYLYYDEPLSPTGGMQNQLPILLAEYSFHDKNDVENYLLLLQSIPAYFDGLATFEKEKSEQGLFMSADACRKTIQQCNEIISEQELSSESHFLQTSFRERIQELTSEGYISSAEADVYIRANNEILLHTVLPAYKSLAHNLTTLCGTGTNENGLCYYPQGQEYYEILIAKQTGSSKSPTELMSEIKTSFLADYNSFTKAALSVQSKNAAPVFSLSEPDKMLTDLEHGIRNDFPAYPVISGETAPAWEIKEVSATMEDYLSPAFYLTPPMDDVSENVIYINYGSSPDNLELYTTLAHEGYPGHLYQSVYSTLAWEEQNVHPIRHLLHFGGYVEGYATYAEFYSYEYAYDFGNRDYCDLVLLNRKLHLALYSMLDISIHYYGATYEDAHETLSAFGIEDKNVTREIYDYIVNSPGNYLQYYVGYLEIMECRQLAQVKWKDNYSNYNFHEFLLDFGPADFETIKDAIREYRAPKVPDEVSLSAQANRKIPDVTFQPSFDNVPDKTRSTYHSLLQS